MSKPSSSRTLLGLIAVFGVVIFGWFAIGATGQEGASRANPALQVDDNPVLTGPVTGEQGDRTAEATPAQPDVTTLDATTTTVDDPPDVISIAEMFDGGIKLRTETALDLGSFTPAVSGNAIVFVTVIMANDAETVPPILVNGAEPFTSVAKNEVAARRLLAFVIPVTAGVPLQFDAVIDRSIPSAKVSWTATFTTGTPTSTDSEPGDKLQTALIIGTTDGIVITGSAIGTAGGDAITGDPAAIGSQQGEATRGQTFTQWASSVPELSATWSEPAHAMGISISIS